jgi:hypothetical protein
MDSAKAGDRNPTIVANAMLRCVGGRGRRDEAYNA